MMNKNKLQTKQFQNYFIQQTYLSKQQQEKQMKIRSSISRYEVDEGFEQHHQALSQPIYEIQKSQTPLHAMPISKFQSKSRSFAKKQQAKLRFISIQRQKSSQSSHYEYLKKEQQNKLHKSMTLNKEEQPYFTNKKKKKISRALSRLPPPETFTNTVIRMKRSEIGENLEFIQFNAIQVKTLKESILGQGASLVFEDKAETNSHGLFKKYLKMKGYNFLKSKYNSALFNKINNSFISSKHQISDKLNHLSAGKKQLQFISDFESSNLDFVTQINPYEYDLYLKADTNTMGHQNWFYFKLLNHTQQKKTIFINICNLKRGFKMIKKGQKMYYRWKKLTKSSIKTSIQTQDQQWTEWIKLQQQVTITPSCINVNNIKRKVYKFSFSSSLLPQMQYQFSLMNPFTYSDMLQMVEAMERSCKESLTVQTLAYSHLGLAIPLLTFTNKETVNQNKKVILISGRIHPGETCATFVIRGILQKLSSQSSQTSRFLQQHIIKIIPILNPDGVVLGNFRTNYLGSDLNRSFNQQNESTFPEVMALKQLGKQLKEEFKEKFVCFLDFHGHSAQKNIFSYGPNYDEKHKLFLHSRFLPKALSLLTDEFDYDKCTFVLDECKFNTARGYFLGKLNVMAFTIQSSYALYDSKKSQGLKNQDLRAEKLIEFGHNTVRALILWNKENQQIQKLQKLNDNELSSPEDEETLVLKKIKKQLNKQCILQNRKKARIRKNSVKQESSSQQDSDGESESQDIPVRQRQKLYRRFIEATHSSLFPRILRPAIIHPEVNPPTPLFSISKISPSQSLKNSVVSLRIKRNKYNNIRTLNANNAYTDYLMKEIKGLETLKPSVNLMRIFNKDGSPCRSSSNNYQTK